MSNQYRTVLYVGVTNNLIRRCEEHKSGKYSGFTKQYRAFHLIYFETFNYIDQAIRREKQIKGWSRDKKDDLITTVNPDLSELNPPSSWIASTVAANEVPRYARDDNHMIYKWWGKKMKKKFKAAQPP